MMDLVDPVVLTIMALCIIACLVYAAMGRRFTDKIVAANLVCTFTVNIICVLAAYKLEDYVLDIAFLFWSIAAGVILAAGMIPLAVIGSVVIGLILLLFVNKKPHRNPYIVVLSCADHGAETQAMQYLTQQTQRCVVKSKSVQHGHIEINAEVRLREENTDFVNTLCGIEGVNSAVLVSYNGDYMG